MTKFVAKDISVSFGAQEVVTNLNLEISIGEWIAIVGPNGAGKSTFLKSLAGIIQFTGSLSLDGIDIKKLSAKDRACWIAYVAQDPVTPYGMRVYDYIMLGRTAHLSMLARESQLDVDVTDYVIEELALQDFVNRRVESLSGGERQRVAIARALAQASPIVLLDEPTSALDVGFQQEVLELIDRLRNQKKIAVITTMHDLTIAGMYPDRLLLLSRGKVQNEGTANQVLTKPNILEAYGADVELVKSNDSLIVIPKRTVK